MGKGFVKPEKMSRDQLVREVELLREALDTIADGFIVFDADDRVAAFNARQLDLFSSVADIVEPGISYRELLQTRADRGDVEAARGREDEWIAECLERHAQADGVPREQMFDDGRTTRVTEYRMPSGGIVALRTDISEYKKTAADLQRQREAYEDLLDLVPDAAIIQCDGKVAFANPRACQLLGYPSVDALVGEDALSFVAPALQETALDRRNRVQTESVAFRGTEMRHQRTDGSVFDSEMSIGPVTWNGRDGTIKLIRDRSQRREAERALQESESNFRNLVEGSLQGVCVLAEDESFLFVNDAYARIYGYESAEEILALEKPVALVAPHEQERLHSYRKGRLRGEDVPSRYEFDGIRKDGAKLRLETISRRITWQGQEAVQATLLDITERAEAENKIAESAMQFRALIDASPSRITLKDRDGRFILVNKAFADDWNTTVEEAVGKTAFDYGSEEDANITTAHDRRVMEAGRVIEEELELTLPSGQRYFVNRTKFPVFDVNGDVAGVGSINSDITEMKTREAELAERTAMLQAVLDTVPAFIALRDNEDRYSFVNQRAAEHFDMRVEDMIGKTTKELLGTDYPATFSDFLNRIRETGALVSVPNYRSLLRSQEGKTLWLLGSPVIGADGEAMGIVVAHLDMTEQRAAEDQLRQAQKMEIVGQLTGGVAHDFNNLLGIILGNLEFLSVELADDSRLQARVEPAINAALSGAELNRQLLAFSRQQPLSPRVIDVNHNVSMMLGMLRRTLGETVEIEARQSDGLWPADIDPAQLESAILNLAVNARDAMPRGGRLRIETGNVILDDAYARSQTDVAPGEYIALSLTDTGTGMTPEVLEHAFEPFFTTKEVGQGTGLGLSMVFGFAKQSGGHLTIDSVEGEGTTVRLYLPRAQREAEAVAEAVEETPTGNGETVLVVEDDPELRALITSMLTDLGYGTLEAGDGVSAFETLEQSPDIDLLLTDIVLPGDRSGTEIAAEARTSRPGLRVLYMSGYPREATRQQNRLPAGESLLEKPFRRSDFARRLRDVLDAAPEAVSGQP